MDCTDCHNRPAHAYAASPERAVDQMLGAGIIDARVPFVRREAVRALTAAYPSHEAAMPAIDQAMRAGRLTSRQLVEAYLKRIAAYDQPTRLNAIVVTNPRALAEADDGDVLATMSSGSFDGLPQRLMEGLRGSR